MFMFTLSLTQKFGFDNIVMREPVKHLSEQMCGANKHKGKMVLVLLREE